MAFATFCPARYFLPHTNTSFSFERGIALAAAKIILDLHDHGPRPQALPSRHTSPLQNDDGLMVGAFCPLYSSLKTVHVASRRLSVKGVMASMAMDGSNGAPSCDIDNTNAVADEGSCRKGEVTRVTKETQVSATIWLDGTGQCDCSTGIPFLDHMLDQIASHGLFDLIVKAKGDTHIDDHHTNEDIALALGTALAQALGDRKGINRFGFFSAPLDEALVHVTVDLCGRPHLTYRVQIPTERVGTYDTQLVKHFFQSLVNTSGMTLHIHQVEGENSHHIIEATFKAFARALRAAIEFDPRRSGRIPSSKGVLSQK